MNRSLLFVGAALLLWGFGEGMFFNFVPIYLDQQFLLDKSEIGWVLGGLGFFMASMHIPAGHLADRIGRRPLLLSAWVLGLLAAVGMGLASVLPLFLIGFFAYGLTAFVSSPLSSYVTAARGSWSVGAALSFSTASFATGMVLGPLTGGWIGEHHGMRMNFLAGAAMFLLSNACIFFIERQPVHPHDPEAPPPGLWDNRRFVTLMAVLAFAMFAMYLSQPLTPNFLADVRKLSLSDAGKVFTVGALGNSLLALLFSRFEPRRGFVLAQGLVMLFAFFIWKGASLPVMALAYFLLGGFRAGRPMIWAQARELIHDSQMGVTYGIMETISAAIFVLTPPLAGILVEHDPMIVYPLSIGLIALSMIVSYLFSPPKASHA